MLLILDCGSQSIKWKLFRENLKLKKRGKIMVGKKNYQKVLMGEFKKLKSDRNLISIVGHRVVHGGEKFRKSIKINQKNLRELEKYNYLASLHNPFEITGIKVAQKIFPKTKQYAFFDTEFYKDLPVKAYIYPLPENLRKKYSLRRYGFHGISHEYATMEAAKKIGRPFKKLKIISCHLGGGSSITAIKNGKAIDTSMGFTPMEGLMMMTRCGDIDPGIILYLNQKLAPYRTEGSGAGLKIKKQKLDYILNNESGIKGICGLSDMREVLKAAKKSNQQAKLALDIFIYRIKKYIGAYFVVLGGCDLLVFTGAIGEGSRKIRNMIRKNLDILKNTKILVIPTDEELAIAKKIKKYD